MSAVAIPKPFGARPPYNGEPPVRTGFDPNPDDAGTPIPKLLAENVNLLLLSLEQATEDQLPTFLRLIEQRKNWIEAEIAAERLLESPSLPPPILGLWNESLPNEAESDAIAGYLRLLERLDDAACEIRWRLSEKN
jgi:hypothetical protein